MKTPPEKLSIEGFGDRFRTYYLEELMKTVNLGPMPATEAGRLALYNRERLFEEKCKRL